MRAEIHTALRPSCALMLAAASLLPGCDPPLDHEADSQMVAERTAAVYESAARAAAALDEGGQPMARKLAPEIDRHLDRMLDGLLKPIPFRAPASRPRPAATGLQTLRQMMVQTASSDIDTSTAALQRNIRERLLTRANIESEGAEVITYRLRPQVTCADADGNRVDPDCAEFLGRVELRLALTRSGPGHEIVLLVGPSSLQPLSVRVWEREVSVTAKLAVLKPSAEYISERIGDPPPPLPAMMKGTVQLTFGAEGTRKASVALGFLDVIDIRDPDKGLVVRTRASDPRASVLRLGLDGDARKLRPSANLGQTEVIMPLADRRERPNASDLRVVLAGLHGLGDVDLNHQEISFQSLGLGPGPSFAEVRGQRIFQVDLNRDGGRALDLRIAFPDGGRPRLSINPRLDLALMWKLMSIESELDAPAPAHLRDETYRLLIEAPAGHQPMLTTVTATDGRDAEDTKVITGRVQLSSSGVATPVTAEAGQCLRTVEPAPDEHPILGAVSVYTCQ